MSDEKTPRKPAAAQKQQQERLDRLRDMVRDDIEEQREFVEKLRKKMN